MYALPTCACLFWIGIGARLFPGQSGSFGCAHCWRLFVQPSTVLLLALPMACVSSPWWRRAREHGKPEVANCFCFSHVRMLHSQLLQQLSVTVTAHHARALLSWRVAVAVRRHRSPGVACHVRRHGCCLYNTLYRQPVIRRRGPPLRWSFCCFPRVCMCVGVYVCVCVRQEVLGMSSRAVVF